jgi:hypothetical protein
MTALVGPGLPALLVYAASLLLVGWAIVDIVRRPSDEMPTRRKAVWIICSVVGWLLFGIVGAAVAVVYLIGPRKRMNVQRQRY